MQCNDVFGSTPVRVLLIQSDGAELVIPRSGPDRAGPDHSLALAPKKLLLLVEDVLELVGLRGEAVAAERHNRDQRVVRLHQVFLRSSNNAVCTEQ